MIPNRWYPIASAPEIRTGPVALQRMGLSLVVFRGADGRLRCLRDRCPHRGVKLSGGRVRGDEIECPYHGFRFDGAGQCTAMPCEGKDARIPRGLEIDVFPVREEHGLVWLWWGAAPADGEVGSLPAVPWFPELPDSMHNAYGAAWDSWPLHYVRAIESNFDIHHGAFVHGNLFPGAAKMARVDPIEAVVEGESIDLTGTMRREDGKKGTYSFRIKFTAPSLSLICLSENIKLLVADCPIDDTHCWRYGRYYIEVTKIPGIGKLMAWAFIKLEWGYVQKKQDLPIVEAMTPKVPTEGCDKLVRADVGTARYLKLRKRLLREEAANFDSLPPHVRATFPLEFRPHQSLPVLSETG